MHVLLQCQTKYRGWCKFASPPPTSPRIGLSNQDISSQGLKHHRCQRMVFRGSSPKWCYFGSFLACLFLTNFSTIRWNVTTPQLPLTIKMISFNILIICKWSQIYWILEKKINLCKQDLELAYSKHISKLTL